MENSFYNYPLLIKQLLISPLSSNPEQEIVDNENQRYDYKRLNTNIHTCLLYTSPSPRDVEESRMPSSA